MLRNYVEIELHGLPGEGERVVEDESEVASCIC
jgi:hypothetical protein